MDTSSSRKQVITYIAFLFLFSSFFYFLVLRSGSLRSGMGFYVRGLMWCPALAAFATMRVYRRSFSELGWRWVGKYQWQSWWIPLLYTAIAYAIVWTTGLGGFGNPEFVKQFTQTMNLRTPAWISVAIGVFLMCAFGLLGSLTSALGEEIGWRGFLVPELARTSSFTTTALISGIVWALWHYPVLIWGDYNAGTATWCALTCFTVLVISGSVIFAWMRLKSGSLWTGAMLHASHNLFVQAIFTPLTRNTGKTAWYIDEFGAVLPAVMFLFAIYFWRRRKELPHAGETNSLGSAAELTKTAATV